MRYIDDIPAKAIINELIINFDLFVISPLVSTKVVRVEQTGLDIVSASNVTAPFLAKTLPCMFAPDVTVMEVRAIIVPLNVEPDPNVAELVTCQNTLQDCAPLIN